MSNLISMHNVLANQDITQFMHTLQLELHLGLILHSINIGSKYNEYIYMFRDGT